MNALRLFHIIFLFGFVLILKVPLSASGLIFENNPFYGLSNDQFYGLMIQLISNP